jgi:hypothetical protein
MPRLSSISRGPITSRLLDELMTESFPVGDNAEPTVPYGWSGEPNDPGTTFTPWLTLSPGTATAQNPSGPMADTQADWRMTYAVLYAGLSRKQTEALADRMRLNLTDIARENVSTPTGNWRIQKIACLAIGNTTRIGSAYPDYFTQADTFEVWVTKGS